MGSTRLRQGPQQHRLAGISWRSTVLGLVLGAALLVAMPAGARAAADLSVTNSASPEPVLVGGNLTYTIAVHNEGPDAATAATLQDELSLGLTFVSADATGGGTCSNTPGPSIVQCNLGTLAPGAGGDVTVTIVAHVTTAAPPTFVNDASVYSPDDTNPGNDTSPDVYTTAKPAADLGITMTAVPDRVRAGEFLTYTLIVENKGPSDAPAVTVTDTLPAGTTLVTATATCSAAARTLTCDVGDLPSGQSATLNITVLAMSAGSITNDASVVSSIDDPDAADNAVSVGVTVSPVPASPTTGGGSKSQPLNAVLTGSYVLISGRSVKLVKHRFVPLKLTCAGPRRCEGRITVSTAKPIKTGKKHKKHKKHKKGKKRKRRVARLGSRKFAIGANDQQKVLVRLSKSKIKLLRRLKRVKAKAAIREIDLHGNPRLSTRTFTLRAR